MTNVEERIAELEARIEALEKKVDSQTTTNGNDEPGGRFANIGGIERLSVRQFESTEEPIDFSSVGGKVVRPSD